MNKTQHKNKSNDIIIVNNTIYDNRTIRKILKTKESLGAELDLETKKNKSLRNEINVLQQQISGLKANNTHNKYTELVGGCFW